MKEYRENTAKLLGLKLIERQGVTEYIFPDKSHCDIQEWKPDMHSEQRELIEDQLINEGYTIQFTYHPSLLEWLVQVYKYNGLLEECGIPVEHDGNWEYYMGEAPDRNSAFMNMFNDYFEINQ